jgi:peroxiredoxin
MNIKFSALILSVVLVTRAHPAAAGETNTLATEFRETMAQLQAKLKDGKKSEADLELELKAFDAILAKYKDGKADELAQVLMTKAMVYSQVLGNETEGDELLAQLRRDFPDSKPAVRLKRQEEIQKARAAAGQKRLEEAKARQPNLEIGATFPDFVVQDTEGKPLSLAAYKGKVVLLDFWATWCGPCLAELPNVLKAYEKHHAAGFEVIGISLDKDPGKLATFVKQKKMNWPQFCDGKGWDNELAQNFGVTSIPATYLLDREGKIRGVGLRGEKLEEAVAAALAKQ